MKNRIVLRFVLIYLSLWILACNDNVTEPSIEITAKPVVKKTTTNYSEQSFLASFPDMASLNSISSAYSNNYSEELRNKILDYMRAEVNRIGEDVNVFDGIILRTNCKLSGGYLLPTYAEKARFENRNCWVFQITYGIDSPDFGHSKCFVFDAATLDTLTYRQCR